MAKGLVSSSGRMPSSPIRFRLFPVLWLVGSLSLKADPAMTRALNSLLMVVKFSLEAVSLDMESEEDRWWLPVSHTSLRRPGGGCRGGGARGWMSRKSSSSPS